MDIPKAPANSTQTPSVSMQFARPRETVISDINSLGLQLGKAYPAKVVLSQQNQTSSESPIPAKTSEGATETKAATQSNPKLQANEYLVRINAKTILINSDKTLAVGDKLLLSLDPNPDKDKPTLLARTLGQNTSSPMTHPSTALSPDGTVHANRPTQHSNLLNTPQITQLLQALNLTLDKQVPLQDGFRQLSTLLSGAAATESPLTGSNQTAKPISHQGSQMSIEPALRQLVQQHLISSLARSNDILNDQIAETLNRTDLSRQTKSIAASHSTTHDVLTSNSAGGVIKSALLNSGLFLESSLLNQPDKLLTFKAQLASLQNSLNQINNQVSELKPGNAVPLEKLGNSLNKIQQTIEQLLHHTTKTTQGNTPANSTLAPGDTHPALADLKASLVSLAAQVARQLAREASSEAVKNLFLLPIAEDYALSPFAFPLLSAKSASAKSLFEKQEFTTGQLLKLLAGMIHRLQFNQLHSLLQSNSNADAPVQQSWFFELPLINPQQQVHTFNFRIDKEAQSSQQQTAEQEKATQWKLLLSFDLEQLGPIYVQVKFLEQISAATPSISSVLWADKVETLKLLQTESAQFRKSLENLGLNVTELRCEQGQPNQTRTRLDRHLVDTRA